MSNLIFEDLTCSLYLHKIIKGKSINLKINFELQKKNGKVLS